MFGQAVQQVQQKMFAEKRKSVAAFEAVALQAESDMLLDIEREALAAPPPLM